MRIQAIFYRPSPVPVVGWSACPPRTSTNHPSLKICYGSHNLSYQQQPAKNQQLQLTHHEQTTSKTAHGERQHHQVPEGHCGRRGSIISSPEAMHDGLGCCHTSFCSPGQERSVCNKSTGGWPLSLHKCKQQSDSRHVHPVVNFLFLHIVIPRLPCGMLCMNV